MTSPRQEISDRRRAKFRQAAFFYLHVAVLYEAAVWTLHGAGRLPSRGPIGLWLIAGGAIAAAVFWGLWVRHSVRVARGIWLLGLFRLPALIRGAFLPSPDASLPPSFYLVALAVVTLNLWLLARAGWDL